MVEAIAVKDPEFAEQVKAEMIRQYQAGRNENIV
jgi:hypothetical protein